MKDFFSGDLISDIVKQMGAGVEIRHFATVRDVCMFACLFTQDFVCLIAK